MDVRDAQRRVQEFDEARGWDTFQPLEVFAAMSEETAEIWQRIAWVEDAEKRARAAQHREQMEFDVGDLLRLVLKLANQLDVDAEAGLQRVLTAFGERYPIGDR